MTLMTPALLLMLFVGQAPPPPPPPEPAACVPGCRSGYTCVQGQCVSVCNPPCGAGETCTAARECVLSAQPGAVREAPPVEAPSPGGGIAMAVTGGVLLGVGVLALLSTIYFWMDGLDLGDPPEERSMSSEDARHIVVGGMLTVFGLAAAITGSILLPVGVAKARAASQQASQGLAVTPRFALTPGGAWLGLAARF